MLKPGRMKNVKGTILGNNLSFPYLSFWRIKHNDYCQYSSTRFSRDPKKGCNLRTSNIFRYVTATIFFNSILCTTWERELGFSKLKITKIWVPRCMINLEWFIWSLAITNKIISRLIHCISDSTHCRILNVAVLQIWFVVNYIVKWNTIFIIYSWLFQGGAVFKDNFEITFMNSYNWEVKE